MTTSERLSDFVECISTKLRSMKIPQSFSANTTAKSLFKQLLQHFDYLEQVQGEIASAEQIPVDYHRVASLGLSQERHKEAVKNGVGKLAELLYLLRWTLADVIAKALVYEMTNTEKAKKAIRRSENQASHQFPHRFLLHVTLRKRLSPAGFVYNMSHEWEGTLNGCTRLEQYGWMQGTLGSEQPSPDGMFLEVSLDDPANFQQIETWLLSWGGERVSAAQVFDVQEGEVV